MSPVGELHIRVVVVDDHEVVRAGLRMLLARFPDLDLVGEAPDGEQAVDLVARTEPDVVIMDLSMPVMDGVAAKDADPDALAGAIRAAARGEAPLDPRAARALLDRRRDRASGGAPAGDTLSSREREVLALVGAGLSNRLIARRLGISEKTVKAHLTNVFAQIGVTDRVQAALWWQRHGAQG